MIRQMCFMTPQYPTCGPTFRQRLTPLFRSHPIQQPLPERLWSLYSMGDIHGDMNGLHIYYSLAVY